MEYTKVPSNWIRRENTRLDVSPFVSGVVETKIQLEDLPVRKESLHDLTCGPEGGIFNGPHFKRNYVMDPEHGVPFLGSSAMLMTDFSSVPYLQESYANSDSLAHLELKEGMTLISCSGTIGKMVYVRPQMDGMWSSQHILKVNPKSDKIRPGYLYSFLSSKFGVPLVTSGTYGSVIQHIEPDHIADLPVPRLPEEIEEKAHSFVQASSEKLTERTRLLQKATDQVLSMSGLDNPSRGEWYRDHRRLGWEQTSVGTTSFRPRNYDERLEEERKKLRKTETSPLGSLCDPNHFQGKIFFKRIDADPEYARRLIGQRDAFRLRPDGRWISESSIEGLGLVVPEGTTLIPSHGTLGEYELYCRAVYVTPRTSEYAFSGDFFRCIPQDEKIPSGYLFAYMRSELAFRMLRSISTGSKQQEQHQKMMWNFKIPRLPPDDEKKISNKVDRAAKLLDEAIQFEKKAIDFVEAQISQLSNGKSESNR